MTKNYIQPTIEVMNVHSMVSICAASGSSGKTITIDNGKSYIDEGSFK